ncbi:MAG TPA: hypothetical protein DIT94_04725, partial [Deltaproteobacteria bacterium]|nr:hypothetical protein [Deltaproteobacteria bacterium]
MLTKRRFLLPTGLHTFLKALEALSMNEAEVTAPDRRTVNRPKKKSVTSKKPKASPNQNLEVELPFPGIEA